MTKSISTQDIDALLAYLPLFSNLGADFEAEWISTVSHSPGEITEAYPRYPNSISEFFDAAAAECWCDHTYDPFSLGEAIQDDAAIASAPLKQLRSLLTYCVRGERFCDGHWADMIRQGRVIAILRRLKQLREERLA